MTDSSPVGRTAPAKKAKPRTPKAKPSGSGVARYHYHQNRATGTFVVHPKVEVDGKPTALDMQENEFASRSEMTKAVSGWLAANDHSFGTLASTKHCN